MPDGQGARQAGASTPRRAGGTLLLIAVWTVPTALALALTTCVYTRYRIAPPARLDDATRQAIIAVLRAAIDSPSGDLTAADAAASVARASLDTNRDLHRPLADRGPVVARLWVEGRPLAHAQAYGDTLASAVRDAAAALAGDSRVRALEAQRRTQARIQVDIVSGRATLPDSPAIARALGIHPGLDGLGVVVAGKAEPRTLLMPDELAVLAVFGKSRPLLFIPDFTIGLDLARVDIVMAEIAGLSSRDYAAAARTYFRFRTVSFIEPVAGRRDKEAPAELLRGLPDGPAVSAASLRQAALDGGKYLVAHLGPDGRYIYLADLTSGQSSDPRRSGAYSLPRHAGTTYFLAELYRHTGAAWLKEPIERAFSHLGELVVAGGCMGSLPDGTPYACVVDRGERVAGLGSTALTVVALAEYQRATGSDRYAELAARLTAWILWMQRSDGSFAHLYNVLEQRKNEHEQKLYYAGEAALALARMHAVTGQDRYRDAAERALDNLVAWYDFFLGGFFYGEEHWTCIAAEAAYPAIKQPAYLDFCNGFAAFYRQQQPVADEFPDQPDYVGSYNATPFLIPQNTPAGSRTEAMISTYLLGVHHGEPSATILAQIERTAGYLLRQQIRAGNDFAVVPSVHGVGAVPASPVDRLVRIDYVQHVGSAMLRAAELLAGPGEAFPPGDEASQDSAGSAATETLDGALEADD